MTAARTPRARAGFTLLEVMVAVAILGIAMTAILYGQAQSIRAQARTQNVTLATLKAMEALDEALIRRDDLPRAGESREITFEAPYEHLRGTLSVEENPLVPDRIRDVTFTISWAPEAGSGSRSGDRRGSGAQKLEICLYIAELR